MGGAIVVTLFVILVAPSLVACLVQRARQSKGARVDWDDGGVTEWDGPWQRATIPWNRLEVACQRWVVRVRGTVMGTYEAIQLTDRETRAVINVWQNDPPGAPVVRKRIYARSGDLASLIDAVESHDAEFKRSRQRGLEHAGHDLVIGQPDWTMAADPDRPRPRLSVVLGRLGYPLALVAPIVVGIEPFPGYAMAALGTALLAFRAIPVFRELKAIRARLSDPAVTGPQADALRIKRNAAGVEALFRATFAALVPVTTALWVIYLPIH